MAAVAPITASPADASRLQHIVMKTLYRAKCYDRYMYTAKQFSFGSLEGISQKQLEVHIKLYEGYVKFINVIDEKQKEMMKDSEKYAYELGEITRRIGFE